MNEKIGERIRGLREHRGLDQKELARSLRHYGVRMSDQLMNQIEKGKRRLDFETAGYLAKELKCNIADLYPVLMPELPKEDFRITKDGKEYRCYEVKPI
jgi:transcriptional regulator with XRE-family HTH domain